MDFWRFRALHDTGLVLVEGSYNMAGVFISLCIASISAYAMLLVVERCWHKHDTGHDKRWLVLGAVMMGLGVWSMHFTGMLAFELPYAMHMNWPITIVSAIPVCIGAYLAVALLARQAFEPLMMQAGALSLALGIGTMHYVGMEAMSYEGVTMRYSLPSFLLSIILAHVFALGALYARVWGGSVNDKSLARRILSAVLIGCAVSAMHYMAMSASEFYANPNIIAGYAEHAHDSMSWIIIIDVVLLIGIVVTGVILGTRLNVANNAAKSSIQRENAVISSLADALLVLDSKGDISTYNVSAQRLFGARHSPLEQRNVLDLIPELGSFEALERWEHSHLETGKSGLSLQFSTQSKQQPLEHFEVVFSRLFFDEQLHYVALIRDISKRVQMEQQLRQAQKLESIGQLAAGIAHEINTPIQYVSDNMSFLKKAVGHVMQAIEMYRQVVSNCCDESSKEQVAELEKMLKKAKFDFIRDEIPKSIEQSADGLGRVTTIVRAMKSFSHASDGEFSVVDLREALESTTTICRNEWKYVAELELDIDPQLPQVSLILDEFNQVILNLVVNAAHAIDEGRSEEDTTLGHIKISAHSAGDQLKITVRDDGCGIAKENQEKVFEPFFTTKVVGKGTGQGLNIAYSVIVEKHGGHIDVESTPGEGTCFTLTVPMHQDAKQSESSEIGEST